jgi:hypothetical protein
MVNDFSLMKFFKKIKIKKCGLTISCNRLVTVKFMVISLVKDDGLMITGGIRARNLKPGDFVDPASNLVYFGESDAEMLGTCDLNKSEFGLCGIRDSSILFEKTNITSNY